MAERQLLAQEAAPSSDRSHRREQRHQDDIGRAGAGENAEIDDIGERGRKRGEGDERARRSSRSGPAGPRGDRRQGERHQHHARGRHLACRDVDRREAAVGESGERRRSPKRRRARRRARRLRRPHCRRARARRRDRSSPRRRQGRKRAGDLRRVKRSLAVKKWATITVNIGVVALRIEARPLARCVCAQTMSAKGTTLLMRPRSASARRVGEICARATGPSAARSPEQGRGERHPRQRRSSAAAIASPRLRLKKNDPPQNRESSRSKPHSPGVMARCGAAVIVILPPMEKRT